MKVTVRSWVDGAGLDYAEALFKQVIGDTTTHMKYACFSADGSIQKAWVSQNIYNAFHFEELRKLLVKAGRLV